jgi:glycopeptide antibiotics resistance protein
LCGTVLFGFYIIAAAGTIFFPISIPLNWPANLSWKETLQSLRSVNLSPLYFLDFTRHPFSLMWLLRDFGLNAILTIPFGVGLGFFHRPKWLKLLFWAVLTGLTLEGIQLLVKLVLGTFYHTVDINDVILNTLGVIIGYCIFLILQRIFHKPNKTRTPQAVKKQD